MVFVREDVRNRRGMFQGLTFFLHAPGRSGKAWDRDKTRLCDNGAGLIRRPDNWEDLTAVIVEVPSTTRTKDYIYPLPPATARPELSQRHWSLEDVLRRYAQDVGPGVTPVLQHHWVADCIRVGRFLGEEDDWGGWRVKASRDPRLRMNHRPERTDDQGDRRSSSRYESPPSPKEVESRPDRPQLASRWRMGASDFFEERDTSPQPRRARGTSPPPHRARNSPPSPPRLRNRSPQHHQARDYSTAMHRTPDYPSPPRYTRGHTPPPRVAHDHYSPPHRCASDYSPAEYRRRDGQGSQHRSGHHSPSVGQRSPSPLRKGGPSSSERGLGSVEPPSPHVQLHEPSLPREDSVRSLSHDSTDKASPSPLPSETRGTDGRVPSAPSKRERPNGFLPPSNIRKPKLLRPCLTLSTQINQPPPPASATSVADEYCRPRPIAVDTPAASSGERYQLETRQHSATSFSQALPTPQSAFPPLPLPSPRHCLPPTPSEVQPSVDGSSSNPALQLSLFGSSPMASPLDHGHPNSEQDPLLDSALSFDVTPVTFGLGMEVPQGDLSSSDASVDVSPAQEQPMPPVAQDAGPSIRSPPGVTDASSKRPLVDQTTKAQPHTSKAQRVPSRITPPHTPQLFTAGPHSLLFHVLDAPGRSFIESTITNAGGILTDLPFALFIILSPATPPESVMRAAERAVCARIVSSKWVTDSMLRFKLLDPKDYELPPEEITPKNN